MRKASVQFRQRRSLPPFFVFASGQCLRALLCSSISALSLITAPAQAAVEGAFLEKIQPPLEQTVGYGQTALWTMPDIATQYQPLHPTPAIQAALQAQREGRFLDALIVLEDAIKSGQASEEARDEMNLLRSSFLLQGNQPQQALEILAPLTGKAPHAADAYALTAMARLQQGQMQQALEAAQRARDEDIRNKGNSFLPYLSLSYALQGTGRLAEARAAVHEFNSREPQQAVALAREAELALTLDQVQTAGALVAKAQESWAANPYVVAVGGLVDLIGGRAAEAKAAFEAALRYDAKDTKALLGLGLAEVKLGNFSAGLKQLHAANEASPGNALILTYLGRAQQQAGQTEAAMASWRSAQQADPKDPTPWLYQAQAELQANRLPEARESLREAHARAGYRAVYRGERLLGEDEQLLQANLAEIQRRLGMENIAFHTLADTVGEKNSATLRNQADLLQGQRFGESARRSLLLQSLFNERPGTLPSMLDVYGDAGGLTGATTPQHGAVTELGAQRASYNNYDELFGERTTLATDAVTGGRNTTGEQIRLSVGNDTLGLGLVQRKYRTDGFAPFDNLDNGIWNATVQWRPLQPTQMFVSRQSFTSQRGETILPTLPWGSYDAIKEHSTVMRVGLRHSLSENRELRALWGTQRTDQANNYEFIFMPVTFSMAGSSDARSAELQYRQGGARYATQWGVQQFRGQVAYLGSSNFTKNVQQLYAAWQEALSPFWQLDAGLAYSKTDSQDNTGLGNNTYLARWLPRLGLVYVPDSGAHVRLAVWRGMGIHAVGDATLAPATLAGVVLARPGDNGRLVRGLSLGADKQLGTGWLLEAQAQQRVTKDPYVNVFAGPWQEYFKDRIDESWLALRWQPDGQRWAVKLVYDHERIQNDPVFLANDAVNEQSLRSQQLEMRWFASERWVSKLAWSHNRVTGTQKGYDVFFNPTLLPYQDGFSQVDADIDWKFAKWGSLTAGVRNATDARFQYMDIGRLNPRFSAGRLAFGKLNLDW